MSVYVQDPDFTLYHGDALDVLAEMPDASVHALVARNHGRKSIGVELNADYCRLAADRMAQQTLLAGDVA